jgi:hypothetical protein
MLEDKHQDEGGSKYGKAEIRQRGRDVTEDSVKLSEPCGRGPTSTILRTPTQMKRTEQAPEAWAPKRDK